MQAGTHGYSLQRDPFSLQQAYTTDKKAEATHCNELHLCYNEHQWPEQSQNGMNKVNVARLEQKNSQSITETSRAEQTIANQTWLEQSRTIEQSRKGQRVGKWTKHGHSKVGLQSKAQQKRQQLLAATRTNFVAARFPRKKIIIIKKKKNLKILKFEKKKKKREGEPKATRCSEC